jgi:hypothetical protein
LVESMLSFSKMSLLRKEFMMYMASGRQCNSPLCPWRWICCRFRCAAKVKSSDPLWQCGR